MLPSIKLCIQLSSSLSLSFIVSLGHFRIRLSATLLTINKSLGDPFAWSREGSRSWVFDFPVLARVRPTTTGLRLGFFFFFFFGRATPFYGASPEPPPSAYRQPRCRFPPRYLLEHLRGQVEEELRKERRGERKEEKLKIHDRHSTLGDCSRQEQQQRSSNHRIILLRVTRPSQGKTLR